MTFRKPKKIQKKENVAPDQHTKQTNQQTLIIDLTLSDDEDDEDDEDDIRSDIRSDTTEVNPDIPSAVPLAAPPINHQTPQPPTKEQPDSAPMERIPSPSPPCYHPPQHFQNMYAPPIMLQSEEEYNAQWEYRAIYYAVSQGQSTTPYLKVTVLRSTLMRFSIAPSHLLTMQLHPGLRHTLQ
ncbi:hypothetical protein DAPPUDRAFT_120530 [Daphnia pulex]|uniref:Uncharacterized protein n=1 Tax=Daphnia pulex TaxID=6669 RepID=E9I1N0_DAPPU|nr:hypothetical protein DAPPUDRAFT_120530 [Daphnia pulex]|eukprot:EFX62100.1 hypothetical protein DAPPUDRAFT_120530 [Daphnia pulex]